MSHQSQRHQCNLAQQTVILTRQTHHIASIGGQRLIQHDHGCSQENQCQHRTSPTCRVKLLNQG